MIISEKLREAQIKWWNELSARGDPMRLTDNWKSFDAGYQAALQSGGEGRNSVLDPSVYDETDQHRASSQSGADRGATAERRDELEDAASYQHARYVSEAAAAGAVPDPNYRPKSAGGPLFDNFEGWWEVCGSLYVSKSEEEHAQKAAQAAWDAASRLRAGNAGPDRAACYMEALNESVGSILSKYAAQKIAQRAEDIYLSKQLSALPPPPGQE